MPSCCCCCFLPFGVLAVTRWHGRNGAKNKRIVNLDQGRVIWHQIKNKKAALRRESVCVSRTIYSKSAYRNKSRDWWTPQTICYHSPKAIWFFFPHLIAFNRLNYDKFLLSKNFFHSSWWDEKLGWYSNRKESETKHLQVIIQSMQLAIMILQMRNIAVHWESFQFTQFRELPKLRVGNYLVEIRTRNPPQSYMYGNTE